MKNDIFVNGTDFENESQNSDFELQKNFYRPKDSLL